MKFYWPMAITTDGEKLFTYEPTLTEEGAVRQIDFWKNEYGFNIEKSWVDCKEDSNEYDKFTSKGTAETVRDTGT